MACLSFLTGGEEIWKDEEHIAGSTIFSLFQHFLEDSKLSKFTKSFVLMRQAKDVL